MPGHALARTGLLLTLVVSSLFACGGNVTGVAADIDGPGSEDGGTLRTSGVSLAVGLGHVSPRADSFASNAHTFASAIRTELPTSDEEIAGCAVWTYTPGETLRPEIDVGSISIETPRTTLEMWFAGEYYMGASSPGAWKDGDPIWVRSNGSSLVPSFVTGIRAAQVVTILAPVMQRDVPTTILRDQDLEMRWAPAEQDIAVELISVEHIGVDSRSRSAYCPGRGGAYAIPAAVSRWVFEPDFVPTFRGMDLRAQTRTRIVFARAEVDILTSTFTIDSKDQLLMGHQPVDFR